MMRAMFFLLGMLFSVHAAAAIDTFTFKDEAQEQQFRQLTEALCSGKDHQKCIIYTEI